MIDDDRNERVHEQLEKRAASGETERIDARAHRAGKPHGWIHNELRRVCDGPPVAAATTDQLKARIDAVREL